MLPLMKKIEKKTNPGKMTVVYGFTVSRSICLIDMQAFWSR